MNVKEENVLMTSRERSMDMCSGTLFSKILIFAFPIMAMYILQLMFNTADMIVVGRFSGSKSLAAVGATGSLINLIITGTLHVIFNLFFVIVLHMSIAGVTSATVISEYHVVLLIMICLMRYYGAIRFSPRNMRISAPL